MKLLASTLAVAALVATGCGNEDGAGRARFDTGEGKSSQVSKTGKSASTTTASDGDSENKDASTKEGVIGVDFPDPDRVEVEQTFTSPNAAAKSARVGVEKIIVRPNSMELRLILTPLTTSKNDSTVSIFDMFENGTGATQIRLIDRTNLKEYDPLKADVKRVFESDPVYTSAAVGKSVRYFRFFPPPEGDIKVVDVKLHDELPVIKDVPLTFEK